MEQVRTRKIQFSVLFAFAFSLLSLALLTVTFASVSTQVREIYRVDIFWVEACSSVFYVSYVVFLVPAYYFEDYFGVRKTLIFGCGLMTFGSFLRIGAYQNFWWVVAGTAVTSVCQPFLMNQVTKISIDWFSKETRVIATTISMVCFLVGQGGSYGISGVFVQLNHGKDQVGRLMIFNAIFCLVSLILVILLIKDKPSNDQSIQPNPKTVKEELGLLIRDFHFICLLVSSGIHMGVGNYFGVILEILVKGSGLTPEDASYIGVITILSGITSCIICSLITSRLYKYRIIIIVSVACTTVLYIFYFYAIQSKSFNLACFASFLYGIFLLPVYSIPLEFACETTFPVREILTSGLINCFAQIFSIIPILVSYWFKNKPWTCIEISVFFQLISLISVFFTKENLKRKHAEEIVKVQNDLIPSYN